MDDPTPDVRDETDATSKERAFHEWMMIGVGLTALMSIMAIIVSMVALSSTSGNDNGSAQAAASSTPASAPAATPPPTAVKLIVKADDEHGKKGPDGTWHDAILPASYVLRPGQTVNVTAYNYDSGPHTFTAPTLGVNAVIAGGSDKAPHETTFKFTAPSQPGSYQWWCSDPCDPWAMGQQGFMQGTVTVRA